jgi:hypothetical protein
MAYPAPRRVAGEVRRALAAQRPAFLVVDEMTNSCMIMKEQREMLDTESFIKKEQRDKCGIRNQ